MLIPWIMAPSRRESYCQCCLWWPLTVSLAIAVLQQGVHSQTVLVNDTISGYVGTFIVLHCSFIISPVPTVKITQVTWQKSTNGSKHNVAIYNPAMGVSILSPYKGRIEFLNPSARDGTIKINNLQLEDQGAYICEFATFPMGNKESQLNLTVLARPTNQMEATTKQLVAFPRSKEKVEVATCISANSKPPSTVTWETKLKGEAEFQEIKHDNGTVTVISRYRLLPTRDAHKQPLTCVIDYMTERFTETTTLNVLYEPEVSIEGFDGNWYVKRAEVKLTCTADANPPPSSFQWRMANGSLPDTAEVNNSTLLFRGPVTYSLSGTYICEAKNTIGSHMGQVEVNVTGLDPSAPGNEDIEEFPFTPTPPERQNREEPSMLSAAIIGGAVGGVLLVLAVSIFLFVVLRRRHHTFKGDYSTKKHVYGNGYSKPGMAQHPPMAQSLQYPEDSDDEKKPGPVGSSSYEEDEDEEDGRKLGPKYDDESKRPYFTVEEGERRGYGEDRTLPFQYEPEDMPDSLVPQNDGSFISKKEWYV
ncbi:nectin-1 isoform X2 [Pelobates cultripes]|uniref:Nectin-1 isoform X2 n=1 Tax=Pelobates cultripes TaxID=61616 RepID=A0AAD1WLV3_PELCU|nr:nectin-1 isoform X2 [Pelobates cultripes]